MTIIFGVAISLLSSIALSLQAVQDLQDLVTPRISWRADGKIVIPPSIKQVKLDIGLSYSAPMSQYWLSHEKELIVFGFEPNPASVASILAGANKRHPEHGDPLDKKFIGKNFFLISCALGLASTPTIPFIVTKDCGCSSLYTPKYFDIEQVIEVPIFSLAVFFDLFPFDTHPVIEYIKIDTQGADLDIVKSGGHYIAERVIYITLEAENNQYANTCNSTDDIDDYMRSIGFIPYRSSNTQDPTYFNPRFAEYVKHHPVQIYQKG
jgi:hypothetical protein